MGFNRKKSWLKKGLALMTSLTLLMGTIGCGGQTEETTSSKAPEETKKEESGQETAASSGNAFEELSLEGVELTIWAPIYWVGKTMTYDDNEAWQKVQEETGVKLTFIHPPAGEETEQFNLMIASDSLPDIICTGWGGDGLFIGGRDKYVEDEIIIPLDDLIDTGNPDQFGFGSQQRDGGLHGRHMESRTDRPQCQQKINMTELCNIQIEQHCQEHRTKRNKTIGQNHHQFPFPTVHKNASKQPQYRLRKHSRNSG